MRHRWLCSTVFVVALGLVSLAPTALADEIKVIAVNAVRQTYLELIPPFEAMSGHSVVTTWSGTADTMKRLKDGETFDLAIIGANSLEELIKLGRIDPRSRVDFVKSGVGIAVRAGAPGIDIGSGDALKQALLSASSIGYSTGPSGVYLDGLFHRMGIAEQLAPKLKVPPAGMSVGEFVARGDAQIGFQQVSELIHVAGVDFLGPLPPDVQQFTVFSTGIAAGAKSPAAARALASYLASPAATAVIKKNGMQPG